MSNGEHEIRTPKGLRIGNRSVVDGKNMLQIKRGGCEDYISAESLVERIAVEANLSYIRDCSLNTSLVSSSSLKGGSSFQNLSLIHI